jgi:hypothetical protein
MLSSSGSRRRWARRRPTRARTARIRATSSSVGGGAGRKVRTSGWAAVKTPSSTRVWKRRADEVYALGATEDGTGSPQAWRALRRVGPVEQRPHAEPIGEDGGILRETPPSHRRDGGEAEAGENAGAIVSALDVARIHDV